MTDLEDAIRAYNEDDFETAIRLLQPLVDSGDAHAQFTLGVLNYNGQGTPYNATEAVRLYILSDAQGHLGAKNALGVCYRNGHGVRKNNQQAFELFAGAAHDGFRPAQFNLGMMYNDGAEGEITKRSILAYMWMYLGALGTDDWIEWIRDWISRDMSREQIAEAEQLAADWIEMKRKETKEENPHTHD